MHAMYTSIGIRLEEGAESFAVQVGVDAAQLIAFVSQPNGFVVRLRMFQSGVLLHVRTGENKQNAQQ